MDRLRLPRISWPMFACSCRSFTVPGTCCPARRMCSAWSGNCGTVEHSCIRCPAIITLTFCLPSPRHEWSMNELFSRPGSWTRHQHRQWRFKAGDDLWHRKGGRKLSILGTKRGLVFHQTCGLTTPCPLFKYSELALLCFTHKCMYVYILLKEKTNSNEYKEKL